MCAGSLRWTDYVAADGSRQPCRERIIVEAALEIHLNNKYLTTVMLTPKMKKEFVAGYLFGQGLIAGAADIRSLAVKGNRADVSAEIREPAAPQKIRSNLKVSTAEIFSGVRAILKSELFAETEAVHSAGLFRGAKTLCIAEDMGRHNALDKVIGHGLLHNVDFGQVMITSTGRLPVEMVQKCLRAGIPVVASKGAVTATALDIARRWGLTVVGFVREKGSRINTDMSVRVIMEATMKIYTHAGRVTGAGSAT